MPAHKNQHFVPRCLLKPFTLNSEGKAINLYSFSTTRLIRNASVRNQCARDYIYGEDGRLEAELAAIEGQYTAAFNRIQAGGNLEDDLATVRFFAYLQLRRTEMAMTRLRASQEGLFNEIFGPDQEEHPPQRYYMIQSLQGCFETLDMIDDLKVRIVENMTTADFVISDDPATLFNKYTTQRLGSAGFGAASSGLVLTMPLSPKLAVVCYDSHVYTIPAGIGRLFLRKPKDVEALNELQFLYASSNIYFSAWDTRDEVQTKFEASKDRRLEDFVIFKHLIFKGMDENGEIYVEGTKEEAKAAEKSMIHTTTRYPKPASWISELRYRNPIRTFSNGTGAGHVRKEKWLRGR